MNLMLLLNSMRKTGLFLLFTASILGCVRVEADRKSPEPTRMIVTRDTKGVNMQFKSVEGLKYTVYYRSPNVPNHDWKQLPVATEIPGTGELILIRDSSPDAFYRKYRIQSLVPVSRNDLKNR